jgi:hypothetical protein
LVRRHWISILLLGLAFLTAARGDGFRPSPSDAGLAETALLKSRKLMPDSLRQILERRESWLKRGFREPGSPRSLDEARQSLDAALADQARLLAGQPLFDDVVAGFGRIARSIWELNAWRRYTGDDPSAACFDDYEPYAERKGPLFVPVFYDYSPLLFEERRLDRYIETMQARNRNYTVQVMQLYRDGGSSRTFDDRSPAFGLAALHYSHTITDIANLWLYCWREANGDLGGVPFFPYPIAIRKEENIAR